MSAVTRELVWRYPQLSLPIMEGMSNDSRYTDIIRRGLLPESPEDPFFGSEEDTIFLRDTPIGPVEVILLADRRDFERFLQGIVYRCEPTPIPASMGADTIFRVRNWRKIEAHKRAFLQEHPPYLWKNEFNRFVADKENYCDNILLVSCGSYSDVPAEDAGFGREEWLAASLKIRTAHELTHLVSITLWPQYRDTVRDEILADAMGLWDAFGHYDTALALRLVGIYEDRLLPGGRLRNYVSSEERAEILIPRIRILAEEFGKHLASFSGDMFECLRYLEENEVGL